MTRRLEWVLRLGAAACFVGHGVFGLLRKPAWLDYFAVLGVGPEAATLLMPLVGALDVAVGVSLLVRPAVPVLLWATFWGLWTALLRPLAGEPVWETLERAGNYGVPLALLLLLLWRRAGGEGPVPTRPGHAAGAGGPRVAIAGPGAVAGVLRATVVLLLLGHGALALGGKVELGAHLASIGLPASWTGAMGALEVAMAGLIALRPAPVALLGVAGWKVATEALFLTAGAPLWEFVERGGSYAAPLALALLLAAPARAVRRGGVPAEAVGGGGRAPDRRAAVRTRAGLLALLLLAALPAAGRAQASGGDPPRWQARAAEVPGGEALDGVIQALREGGLVLLCRHAITDHSQSDRGGSREQQRNLSEAGRSQARALGEALRALGVPIGDVRASPMYRTMDSAELGFGAVEEDGRLRGAGNREALRRFLAERPARGNRVLMTHQGTIRRVVPIGRAPLEEGDCLVLRPDGEEVELLARVGAADWGQRR